jgi:predicted GNAT superfamily acetyltransferase
MLGVRASARNLGLGRRLKEYQRDAMRAIGVKRIVWTFDPLMAKNAYFNLNRLGARVVEYVPDMYGTTSSPLHLGMPTDRLIVSLETTDGLPEGRTVAREAAPVLTAFPRSNDVTVSRRETPPEHALIEIPAEILDVLAQSPVSARTWRLAVRDYFQWALAHGYAVTGVRRDATANRSFYVLERERPAAATLPASRELQRAR